MKINIPKILVAVDLAEYAPALQGQVLQMWVNLPVELLNEYNQMVTDLQTQELQRAQTLLASPPDETKTGLQKAFDQAHAWLHAKKQNPVESGLAEPMLAWYANVWSQGPADTQWSVAEMRELEQRDPSLLAWLIARYWQARVEHATLKKKA